MRAAAEVVFWFLVGTPPVVAALDLAAGTPLGLEHVASLSTLCIVPAWVRCVDRVDLDE